MDKVSEDDLKAVSDLLSGALNLNPDVRLTSEQGINKLKLEQPDKLVLALLSIIGQQLESHELASILLRNLISVMTAGPENFVWDRLRPDTKAAVKADLLALLTEKKKQPELIRRLRVVASELEGTLADLDESWPELLSFLDQLLSLSASAQDRACGFSILSEVFPYIVDCYRSRLKQLREVFAHSLSADDLPTRTLCVKALCNFAVSVEPDQLEPFTDLIPMVADTIHEALAQGEEKALKSVIVDVTTLADSVPRFLKAGFSALFQQAIAVANSPLRGEEIPMLAVEMLVSAMERAPSLLLEGGNVPSETGVYFSELFRAVLHIMREYTREPDKSWTLPQELPYSEAEENHVTFGQKAIERMLGCTRRELGLSLLGPELAAYLNNNEDWRCRYVALFAAAQVGPFIRNEVELSTLVPVLVDYIMKQADPRIRFAAVHCVAILSADCEEGLHSVYYDEVIRALGTGLKDHVARVQQESCFALRNFVERMRQEHLDRYLGPIMDILEKLVSNSDSPMIKESAMGVIGTLAETTPDTFRKYYYNTLMPALINVMEKFQEPAYKRFRGQTLDCITTIAKAVGKDMFNVHFPNVAGMMVQIQKYQLRSKDPQRAFLLSSWQRLCALFGAELAPYAEQVVPSMLELLQSVPVSVSTTGKRETSTEEEGETEEAISLIGTLVEHLGPQLDPYADRFQAMLLEVLRLPPNHGLKRAAACSLKGLINCIRDSKRVEYTKEKIASVVKECIAALLMAANIDTGLDNVAAEMYALKDILNVCEPESLSAGEELQIFECIMKMLAESNNRSLSGLALRDSRKLSEYELQLLDEDAEKEESIVCILAQVVGGIMKSNPEGAKPLAEMLYKDVLKPILEEGKGRPQCTFALTVAVLAMRNLTYLRLPELYPEFLARVLSQVPSSDPRLQAIALDGVVAAVVGAGEHMDPVTDQCFAALRSVLTTPMPEQVSRQAWKASQEKAVASLAQVIWGQKDVTKAAEMIALWVRRLPLRTNAELGRTQIDLLGQMMAGNIAAVAGPKGENVKEVIRVILDVLDTEQMTAKVSESLLKGFRNMLATKSAEPIILQCHSELPKDRQNRLSAYIQAATRSGSSAN